MKTQAFPKNIFVTGIGTDVGKTIAATILCRALKADYWKPVQSGSSLGTDSHFVKQFTTENTTIHPSVYNLKAPVSPHEAAALENQTIEIEKIIPPYTLNKLVIEGAGGIMVPLNSETVVLDLIAEWQIPVVLVSQNYLGSINHTLLSCEMLHAAGVPIAGIIFNGIANEASENFILNYTNLPLLGKISMAKTINSDFIQAETIQLTHHLKAHGYEF